MADAKRDGNRITTIIGVSNIDDTTIIPARVGATSKAQHVELVDSSGNSVSVGGGTQYTEADTDVSITGTAMMWEDTGDTLRAVSAAKPLPIGDAGGSLTIDGTVAVSGSVAVTQSGTWDEVGINDSGNSITVDYATTGSGTATGALRVELPTNGTGVIATVGAVTAISNALPAGTNNIGDVDVLSIAAGDNNIGNVDVVTVPSDPFGANADAAATAGSTGSMQAKFRLMTSQLDSIKTAVETLDNTVGGSELQVDIVGSLPAGTNGIGKLTANSGVDIGDVDVTSISAGDNTIGRIKLTDGTTVATVRELGTNDALNVAMVDGSGNQVTSFGGGTQYTDGGTPPANPVGNAIEWNEGGTWRVVSGTKPFPVGGNVAHDGVDSGNPTKIGFKAYSPDGTAPGTAVAELDRTDAKSDLDGRQYVNGEHPRWWSYHEDSSSALTDVTVQSAPGAGFQIVVTEIMISTGAATALNVFFEEGSTKVLGPWYLEAVAGRGLFWKGNKHITANTALTITTSAAIAHGIDIQGYIQTV